MGAILRDEPLCSGHSSALTLRGYCHHEVGAGEIPRQRVGRDGDRRRQKKKQKKENKGQTDRKKNNKEKNRVQLRSQPEQGRQCGQTEVVSETEEGVRS